MAQVSVALWATNLTPRLNGIDAWLAGVDEKLPVDAVRRMRAGEARVWPGAWSAAHITIDDPLITRDPGTTHRS